MNKHTSGVVVFFVSIIFFFSVPASAQTISGNISGPSGAVVDTEVQVVDTSGNWVDATQTDDSGNYSLTVPGDGTYYVYTPWWALTDWTLIAEAYPDATCQNCDVPATGGAILVSGGADQSGIDIVLATGAQATGSVMDADNLSNPLHPVSVDIFDSAGNHLGGTWNQPDGYYALPAVPPGDYRILYNAIQDLDPYLDELNDGTICVNGSCDLASTGSTAALVTGDNLIDVSLARGIALSGSVVNEFGFPLPWAHVEIYDSAGTPMGFINMEEDEFWTIPVPVPASPPENYYARVLDWNMSNFTTEIWQETPCDNCDPVTTGTAIPVSGPDVDGIDFVIAGTGWHILGNVKDSNLVNLQNVEVCAVNIHHGLTLGCATTDVDGNYDIGGLQDVADNISVFVNNVSTHPVLQDMWGGGSAECCDFSQATPIDLSTGSDATGIDFVLDIGTIVFGTLTINDVSSSPVVDEGSVSVFDTAGNWVNGSGVDGEGKYSVVLPDGDYFFYFESWGAYEYYVSEMHDGVDGVQCPWLQCFAGDWVNQGPKLTVDGSWTNPLNAELEQGVIFSGTLTDEKTGAPIDKLRVYFYNDAFYSINAPLEQSFVQLIRGDASGNYRTPALPMFSYSIFSTGWDLAVNWDLPNSYGRELYNDQKCDPVDCDDAFTNRTVLVPGANFSAGDEVTVNINLIRRSELAGRVTSDGSTGIDGVEVNVWDTKGNLVHTTWTDPDGYYSNNLDGHNHAAAEYYITADAENQGYVAQVYGDPSNADCPQEYCVQGGTPGVTPVSTLDGLDRTDINFILAPQAPAVISGTLLANDGSEVGGAVRVFDAFGKHVDDFWVYDENGAWETYPLDEGSYYLVTMHTWDQVINEVWDDDNGAACTNLTCDIFTAGTPVIIQGGVAYSNGVNKSIGFRLEPVGSGGRIFGNLSGENGNPLPYTHIVVLNDQGTHLTSARTDEAGDFTTPFLSKGNFYIRTDGENAGVARELWVATETVGNPDLNTVCMPKWDCDDAGYIQANGTLVNINDVDTVGIDFILKVPVGGQITGNVFDQVLFNQAPSVDFPLMDVNLALLQNDGSGDFQHVADTHSDRQGNFTFAGLADGDYKFFTTWIPQQGYTQECYNAGDIDDACNWGTDFNNPLNGDVITISGGQVFSNADVGLNFEGDRIVGTITNGGEPISSEGAWMGVRLFDGAGNEMWAENTNNNGQYTFYLDPGANDYMLSTDHDRQQFNLINEAWDNVQCFADCTPTNVPGSSVINFTGGTFHAAFELETGTTISGQVTAAEGSAPIADIEVCTARQSDSEWVGCAWTDGNGNYQINGLEARNDYLVFTSYLNGQPFLGTEWPDTVDTTGGAAGGINLVLDSGYFISGTILNAASPDPENPDPIEGLTVCIHYTYGDFAGECGTTDAFGYYQTGVLPPGSDYVAYAIGEELGFQRQVWNGLNCEYNYCDFSAGTPITLGDPDHAGGIDFNLNRAATITGTVSDINGLLTNWTGRARLANAAGDTLTQFGTDENGVYTASGLEPGTYYILGTSGNSNLIDELWDGELNPGVHCPRQSCDYAANGTAIVITGTETVTGINFLLDAGSRITGTINIDGNPQDESEIYFYDGDGDYAGYGRSDGSGSFQSTSGFPAGTWYASNRFVPNGIEQNIPNNAFLPTMYDALNPDGFDCGFPCDIPGTIGSAATSSIDTNGGTDTGINLYNYVIPASGTISGSILDENFEPTPGGAVQLFDSNGNHQGDFWVDENGNFQTHELAYGQYFAKTKYTWNVVDDRWDGDDGEQCANGLCEVLLGAPIIITPGGDTGGINFVLDPITTGGTISGHVEDSAFNGLANVQVVFFNINGEYLSETRTDPSGNYESNPLVDDTYYVRVLGSAGGLQGEFYDNLPCTLGCNDPALVTSSNAVGAPATNIDFTLDTPIGNSISGFVTDAELGTPLAEVWVGLFDEFGNWLDAETFTAPDGSYYFTGLPVGGYKVYTIGVPQNYSGVLYGDPDGVVCPDWTCDFGAQGTVVSVSGDTEFSGIDIALPYNGSTRIFGTVTRDDTGSPVSSRFGYAGVNLYEWNGSSYEWRDHRSFDDAGQFQFDVAPGSYYLVTANDQQFHGLVNEAWDNVPCYTDCDPNSLGNAMTELVVTAPVAPDTLSTAIANFGLGAGRSISGTVTDELTANPVAGVTMCLAIQSSGEWPACTDTDTNGNYSFKALEDLNDYVVFTWNLNGQGYYRETYNNLPCCNGDWIGTASTIDVSSADQVADFALTPSASISGTITDSVTGSPIPGVNVYLATAQCEFPVSARTDDSGNYTISGFEAGIYYVAAAGEGQGYVRALYPNLKRYDACDPDISDGQAIAVGVLESVGGVDFALDEGGSISGTISDASGILPRNAADARLYDLNGKQLLVVRNREPGNTYRFGGLMPGSYHVLLTGRNLGLIDERYPGEHCPRNSCDAALGVPVVVGPLEHVTGIDAQLENGAVFSGLLTDGVDPLANYFIDFYDSSGNYVGFGRSDNTGNYTSWAGFPDGDYLVSNQFIPAPGQSVPVEGGYMPQVWKADGSFGLCGEPCNVLLGDTITVSGGVSIPGINLTMEKGASISGTVTTDAGSTPLGTIDLKLLSSVDGSTVRTLQTDASGNYLFEGIVAGTYFLRTANASGYGDLLFNGLGNVSCNPFCDPFNGEGIVLSSGAEAFIDFDLVTTPSIEGKVTDDIGDDAGGVKVAAYNTLGTEIASTITDSAGNYSLANLWAGTFYVGTANNSGFVDELWNGTSCASGCDPTSGTAISLDATGVRSNINMQLGSAASISGTVSDGANPISGVTMQLYLDTGAFVASTTTDGSGEFRIEGLSADDYHLVSRNTFGYVDEGAGGSVCQTTCAPTSTLAVTVAANAAVVRDFYLDYGGGISGTVTNNGSTPLPGVTIAAYNSIGTQIASTVTNASGDYLIRGLVAGNVYLRTLNAAPYRNQRYDGLACDAFCDVLASVATPVTLGVTSSGRDFSLEAGYTISGTVSNAATTAGIPGVLVEAYDTADLLAGSAIALTGGAFEIDGLSTGDYRLKTTNALGYVDRVLGGDSCTPEPCSVSSGAINIISNADISGVSIALNEGSPIVGVATDTSSNPLPSGSARLYSATGSFLKSAAINSGLFSITGIADGTYYMLVRNELGLVDQLWDSLPCPSGSCDVTSGTPIDIGTAPVVQSTSYLMADGGSKSKTEAAVAGGRLQFGLATGTRISGSVTTESGAPVQFIKVHIFDLDGDVAGEGITNGLGEFLTDGGFPAGSWYAATQAPGFEGAGGGLTDEVFNNIPCVGDCNPVAQGGETFTTPNGAEGIDFVLGTGGEISGSVTAINGGAGIGQVRVNLYDDQGLPVAQTNTNGSGAYTLEGLLDGDYYLVATPLAGNYGSVLYNALYCDGGCVITSGDIVSTGSSGIDFELPDDNCPNVHNPDQLDSDGDGRGDACEGEPPTIDKRADVDPSAQIGDGTEIVHGATVRENAVIGAGVLVSRNVDVGAGCQVGDDVFIGQNVVLGANCSIGDNSFIDKGVILGVNVSIGSGAIISKDSRIDDGATLGNDVTLGRNVHVMAGACIPDGAEFKKDDVVGGDLCS